MLIYFPCLPELVFLELIVVMSKYHLVPGYINSLGIASIYKWGEWSKLALQNRWNFSVIYLDFIYLYLFYCHTITYSIFSPYSSPTHMWWDWSNLLSQRCLAPQALHIPKQSYFFFLPTSFRNFYFFTSVHLWMINSHVSALFPFWPETFS